MNSLDIKNLTIEVDGKSILKDFSLCINTGEIHAVMGPNGVGKSTLSKVIMGEPSYKVKKGKIFYNGKDITKLRTDERARLGIFLGFQYPFEIEGVTNAEFLRASLNQKDGPCFNIMPFIKKLDATVKNLHMDKEMIHRGINDGFSGGEKKKNEILQMHMLEPNMVILDEIDSGLDVDSLKIVGKSITGYHKEYNPGVLIITHYKRLLDYIKPNFVHIMIEGKIVMTGDNTLVKKIEREGYEKIFEEISHTANTGK